MNLFKITCIAAIVIFPLMFDNTHAMHTSTDETKKTDETGETIETDDGSDIN